MKRSDFLAFFAAIPFLRKKKPLLLKDCARATFENTNQAKIELYKKIWFNCEILINGEDLLIKPNRNEN